MPPGRARRGKIRRYITRIIVVALLLVLATIMGGGGAMASGVAVEVAMEVTKSMAVGNRVEGICFASSAAG